MIDRGLMRILLTNDDGVFAEGLVALKKSLTDSAHEVLVSAPDRERSASSQSLTIDRPVRVRKSGKEEWSVDGTPSDCVHLGLLNFFKERPQMVISGINLGLNVADNIFYSGTVAAAMEGLLHGLPAMAVSRKAWKPGDPSLQQATAITVRLAQWWIEQREWNGKCVLNVNFPPREASWTPLCQAGPA